MRRRKPRVSNIGAGVIGAVVIAIACYLVFGGSLPFSGTPFQLKAVFTSETELHIPSPVRVAGVDVGEVTSVTHIRGSSQDGLVTMSINNNGLPIHANATAKIRPRIFLEGNFYVDLAPGSPSARVLSTGATLPVGATSGPVQLDRLLSSLTSSARTNLQTLLRGFGAALQAPSTPAQDATQDPIVRGLTAAPVAQPLAQVLARRRSRHRRLSTRRCSEPSRTTSRSVVSGNPQVFQGAGSERHPARQLRDHVQRHDGGARRAPAGARADDRAAAAVPAVRTQTSDTALDALVRPDQGIRPRADSRASRSSARRSPRGCPGSSRRRC